MKANSTVEGKTKKYKDVNMNIKIYTSNAEFDIKSYIVNEATVEKCKNGSMNAPEGNTYGTINQYIDGGKKENGVESAGILLFSYPFIIITDSPVFLSFTL